MIIHPQRRTLPAWLTPLVLAVFLVPGLVFGWVGLSAREDALRLQREGVATMGTVVDLRETVTRRRGSSGSSQTHRYTLTVEFVDAAGMRHRVAEDVSRGLYTRATQGQQLPLRYAASDPEIIELEPGSALRKANLMLVISALATVFALVSLGLALRKRRRAEGAGTSGRAPGP